ncbi:MAG: hypothetical protein U0235_32770 [Polyangiaceae bacterium]
MRRRQHAVPARAAAERRQVLRRRPRLERLLRPANAWTKIASAACAAQGASLASSTFGAQCGQTGGPEPIDPTGHPGGINGRPGQTGGQAGGSNGSPDQGTATDPSGKPGQPPIHEPPVPRQPAGAARHRVLLLQRAHPAAAAQPVPRIPVDTTTASGTNGTTDAKSEAVRICADKGLSVSSVESDPQGGTVLICCPVQPPPTPPPSPVCSTINVGDKLSCLAKDELEARAVAACAQSGLTLRSVSEIVPCLDSSQTPNGAGGVSLATVTCCGTDQTQNLPPGATPKP